MATVRYLIVAGGGAGGARGGGGGGAGGLKSSETAIGSYSEANQDSTISYGTSTTASAQVFTVGASSAVIDRAEFYVQKSNSPTGFATAKIYAITGTPGSTAVPTGAALATSDNVDVSTLSTSLTLHSFVFSGANQITLNSATSYAVALEYSDSVSTNIIRTGVDTTGAHAGNRATRISGTWSASATNDVCFYLWASTKATFTQGPHTVTIGAGGTAGNNGADSTVGSVLSVTGGGKGSTGVGSNGGSGGGGGNDQAHAGGTGVAGQGFAGGAAHNGLGSEFLGGGGGGASEAGQSVGDNTVAGDGGAGLNSTLSGATLPYAGGGGGSHYDDGGGAGDNGDGGLGGGGNGGGGSAGVGAAGTANRGSGGGGGNTPGVGGSGIAIISYPTGSLNATGGTITTSGGNTIHTFTTSGTFTVLDFTVADVSGAPVESVTMQLAIIINEVSGAPVDTERVGFGFVNQDKSADTGWNNEPKSP